MILFYINVLLIIFIIINYIILSIKEASLLGIKLDTIVLNNLNLSLLLLIMVSILSFCLLFFYIVIVVGVIVGIESGEATTGIDIVAMSLAIKDSESWYIDIELFFLLLLLPRLMTIFRVMLHIIRLLAPSN